MAKVICDFGVASCYEVNPASEEVAPSWGSWKREYQGVTGWLRLCESEKKYPGQQFLYFIGGSDPDYPCYLKTSYGQLTLEGNVLTFITRNSCYVFRLTKKQEVSV